MTDHSVYYHVRIQYVYVLRYAKLRTAQNLKFLLLVHLANTYNIYHNTTADVSFLTANQTVWVHVFALYDSYMLTLQFCTAASCWFYLPHTVEIEQKPRILYESEHFTVRFGIWQKARKHPPTLPDTTHSTVFELTLLTVYAKFKRI